MLIFVRRLLIGLGLSLALSLVAAPLAHAQYGGGGGGGGPGGPGGGAGGAGDDDGQHAMWTGEIEGISSDCGYKGTEPIHVGMNIGFSLGRGPMADGQTKIYHYWIAVTERDKTVLAKQEFDLPVTFKPGENTVHVDTQIGNVQIPRGDITVSGANFEVLIGFDVTPEMADFNRQGKHFRYVTAAEKKDTSGTPAPQPAPAAQGTPASQ